MGKGPRPKGEYVGKSSVFSTRIRPDLRKSLEKAAKTSGRSLSQEVEHRLRRSFAEDEKIADTFGDRRTYRLMRLMSDAIHLLQKENDGHWLDDPFRFRVALAAMRSVVEAIEPHSSLPDDDESQILPNTLGAVIAGKVWSGVVEAKDSIELSGSLADHINSIARSDIGEDVFGRALEGIRHILFNVRLSPAEAQLADQDFYDETLKGDDE